MNKKDEYIVWQNSIDAADKLIYQAEADILLNRSLIASAHIKLKGLERWKPKKTTLPIMNTSK